jgi:hypothetical protein
VNMLGLTTCSSSGCCVVVSSADKSLCSARWSAWYIAVLNLHHCYGMCTLLPPWPGRPCTLFHVSQTHNTHMTLLRESGLAQTISHIKWPHNHNLLQQLEIGCLVTAADHLHHHTDCESKCMHTVACHSTLHDKTEKGLGPIDHTEQALQAQ